MKKCNICSVEKELTEFVKRSNRKNGIQPYCKKCHNKKSRSSYKAEYMKDYDLKKNYGIGLDEFNELSKKQNDCCAICKIHVSEISTKRKKTLCVDHCHETLFIRGLLCDSCNRGIGLLKDSKEVLKSAYDYLSYNNPLNL